MEGEGQHWEQGTLLTGLWLLQPKFQSRWQRMELLHSSATSCLAFLN